MKLVLIKRILNKRLGYKLIVNPYKHIEVYKDKTLIRCFDTEKELFQWVKLIKILGII